MEHVPPSPRKKVPVPVLKADYTPAESELWQTLANAYNRATGEDIVYISKKTGVPTTMVAATLDMVLFFPFAARLDLAYKNAHDILRAVRENNSLESITNIIQKITAELKKTYLFREANEYHVAVLISDDPAINDWLTRRIQNSKTKKAELEEITDNAFTLTPLLLSYLLDKRDIIELLTAREVELGKPSRFHAKILQIARDIRRKQKKWIPSRHYRELMMQSKEKGKYHNQIIMFLKNVQFDPTYRAKLKKEDIHFFNWLLEKQEEIIRAGSTD